VRALDGRILLRLPRSLHGMLAEAAEREGVNLNQFALGVLAGAVGDAPTPPTFETAQRVAAALDRMRERPLDSARS
jgi:hypothetical protein